MTDAATTRLYLVRHCDVRNPDGVLYGHLPGFPLSDKGVRQAHALGRWLAQTPARTIFSSPLERAHQTAAIIASYIVGAEVITTDDLVEARFGRYLQGVRPRDVPWSRPLWLIHMAKPGLLRRDETVDALAARVRVPLDRLLRDHPMEGGICVSHGDPIQGFWVRTEGRRDWDLHRLECMKGGMLILDYEGERLVGRRYRPPEEVESDPGDGVLPAWPVPRERETAGGAAEPAGS